MGKSGLGVGAHASQETKIWRMEANPGKRLVKPSSQQTRWVWQYTSLIPAMRKVCVGGSWSKDGPRKEWETLPKK
jgi:hypothetical protein